MAKLDASRFCDKPDRDNPRMRCGYPRPCPHHSLTVFPDRTVMIPAPAQVSREQIDRVHEIAAAVHPPRRNRR